MSVPRTLFRAYRPMLLWFAVILAAVEVVGIVAITRAGPMKFSFWLVMGGSAAKFWPLVAGIILVSMHFRLFISNGVTRREFLAGLAAFGLVLTAGFAVALVAGHGLESAVLGWTGQRASSYPVLTFAGAAAEWGRAMPLSLAYLATGILTSAGFYRLRPWTGAALLIPGLVPLAVAEGLLNLDEFGNVADRLAYAPALALSLAALAAGAAGIWWLMRDVAIRRAAG